MNTATFRGHYNWTYTLKPFGNNDGGSLAISSGSSFNIGLPFGQYDNITVDIREIVPTGYRLESITCDSDTFDITVNNPNVSLTALYDRGFVGDATCTFTNSKLGSITVTKSENGISPTFDWMFTVTGPNTNETFSIGPSTPEASFTVENLDQGTYTVCETNVPAGWETSLGAVDPNSLEACANVVLSKSNFEVGNEEVNVANTFVQTGEPRSKGYWKNWSACTKGSQFETGSATPEVDTLDEAVNFPYAVTSSLIVNDCVEATHILSGRLLDGQNNNSDGAAALASQLLAAQLNNLAGQFAGCNSEVFDAIASAKQLLFVVEYDATTPVLSPKNKTLKDQRAQAYELEATLEMYNTLGDCALSP